MKRFCIAHRAEQCCLERGCRPEPAMALLRRALLLFAVGLASAQTKGSITNLDDALRTAAELSLYQVRRLQSCFSAFISRLLFARAESDVSVSPCRAYR